MTILSLLLITIIIFILMIGMMISTPSHISLTHTTYAQKNKSANNNVNNYGGGSDNNNIVNQSNIAAINNKVVILNFGDIHKSQYTTAKPILDQYGFKGSFFVPCDMVGNNLNMDWQEILTLYHEGHDIEAKSADDLISLPADQLNFQVSQSKQCLLDQ